MSNRRTSLTRLARRLQRICEEETGVTPSYMRCLEITRKTRTKPEHSREEKAAYLFLEHKEELLK